MKPVIVSRRPVPLPDRFRNGGYWLRLSSFFVVSLTLAVTGLPVALGGLMMLGLLYAPCHSRPETPADYDLEWEAVTLEARTGGSFRGFFISGVRDATIIIPPAGSGSHTARLPAAVFLARRGYNVFVFESRRCAGMGPLSLGYGEVNEIVDVLDYLQTRPDVDPGRIGIKGFSMAGAAAIMAAARDARLRAVVAEGGYGNFAENGLKNSPRNGLEAIFWALFRQSAQWVYRWVTGLDIERLSPVSVIGDVAPRPILLIYGSREASLPGGRWQLAAAGDNAELWIVPRAGHGNYLAVAGPEYEERVTGFFDAALGDD